MFYKRQDEQLLAANEIHAPEYTLDADNKESRDGWQWFDTLDEAMGALITPSDAISAMQAAIALEQSGLLETVETTVQAMGKIPQLAWAKADVLHRDSPLLIQVATAGGFVDQLDDLFALAKTIKV